jgi:RNA polymerase sigma-70 factor, ECF subfamily
VVSDEALMAQVINGNRGSLELLVRRHADALLTFLCRNLHNWHKGEELFQEVFLAVWTKRIQFDTQRPFKPWLYAIAINKVRERFRHPPTPLGLEGDPLTPGKEDAPEKALLRAEMAETIKAAVAQLPEQQRMVVTLRVWNGLSYAEIAESMEVKEPTVRSHMHHALAALRRLLAEHVV